jgi:uncharacterized protein (TIGR03067 family)
MTRQLQRFPTRPWLLRACVALVMANTGAAPTSAPAPAAPPDVRSEMARLQGFWSLESMEINGQKVPDEKVRDWLLVVEGDQYNPGSGQQSVEYTYRIDPTRNPKAIDLIPHEGLHRGRTLRGIYTLKDDRFILCRARTPDGERPAGFATRPDSGLVLAVWKRRKP